MSFSEVAHEEDYSNSEAGQKLLKSLDLALVSISNGIDISDPEALEFKRQIESRKDPFCKESDPKREQVIKEWVNRYRNTLNTIFAEIGFFRRRN